MKNRKIKASPTTLLILLNLTIYKGTYKSVEYYIQVMIENSPIGMRNRNFAFYIDVFL